MSATILYVHGDAKILEQIHKGDDEALVTLYKKNRKMIVSFILKNSGTKDDAEDLLQEAVIVLWEKIRTGKFEYNAQLSTFIFAVVKRLWLRKLTRSKREIRNDFAENDFPDNENSQVDNMIVEERSAVIAAALEKLGDPCKTLLLLFYWEENSMEEIAKKMRFANADTVKAKKYQCKKSLEKILTDEQHFTA